MNLSPCMADLLRRLASMPLLDRLDLAAVSGWSRGAVYDAVARMQTGGLLASLPHATALTPTTERFHLTAAGVRNLARDTGTGVERLLAAWPVSNQWRRILLERLDGVASLYRFAAALSDAAYPIGFRWYRGLPLDAGIRLPDGRTIGVVRQGRTADRTGFAKRLWRLRDGQRPSALFILVPDEVRLRQVRRLLPRLRLRAFLALERDVACAGPDDRVWRLPSAGGRAMDLRTSIASVDTSGALPREESLRRAALPEPFGTPVAEEGVLGWLLPSVLAAPEKLALETLADWPWIGRGDLAGVLVVSPNRLSHLLKRLMALRLVACTPGGKHVLADRGLGYLARRDRTAVGTARQRWSTPVDGDTTTLRWTDVPGRRSRQLLRNAQHTAAVHGFVAALARQAHDGGLRLEQLDPPHRASRFFRHEKSLHSVRPDAFGVVRSDSGVWPFFLEWERRAVRPVTMTARLAPYLRYYATHRPLDDHGTPPCVLVVLPDDIAVTHFLRVARAEMDRTGVALPLYVTSEGALKRAGPLGQVWRTPAGPADARLIPTP